MAANFKCTKHLQKVISIFLAICAALNFKVFNSYNPWVKMNAANFLNFYVDNVL